MKRILFLTTYPSPYKVNFFDQLGKAAEVTVLFSDRKEDASHRDQSWFEQGQGNFRAVQLKQAFTLGRRGVCPEVRSWVKQKWDAIIVVGYSAPTSILAMAYMRMKKIPFYLEVDGGLIRQEGKLKYQFKRTLVRLANRWLSTGDYVTRYLVHYGAKEEAVIQYPFSSLYAEDLLQETVTREEKQQLRRELGIEEERVILSIGQFIHRKGFDVLLSSAASLPKDVGIYIVGGEATEAYIQQRKDLGLENVHFLGFRKKPELAKYYRASDLFVLPTREDIWGLVINEAMAYGLPVITTDRCVAGLELVEDGVNGYIVPAGDADALADKMNLALSQDLQAMGAASLEKIQPYTIENMAKAHVELIL